MVLTTNLRTECALRRQRPEEEAAVVTAGLAVAPARQRLKPRRRPKKRGKKELRNLKKRRKTARSR